MISPGLGEVTHGYFTAELILPVSLVGLTRARHQA